MSHPEWSPQTEYRRLVWKCRRGSKELDLILGRFLEEDYQRVDPGQRRAFDRLLEYPDPDIQDLLNGVSVSDSSSMNRLIQTIRDEGRDSH